MRGESKMEENKKDVINIYPSANDTLTEMIVGLNPENLVITLKFLNVKFGMKRHILSEIAGIPYPTLTKMFETGIGYCNDDKSKIAIKRLKNALI